MTPTGRHEYKITKSKAHKFPIIPPEWYSTDKEAISYPKYIQNQYIYNLPDFAGDKLTQTEFIVFSIYQVSSDEVIASTVCGLFIARNCLTYSAKYSLL